MCIPNVETYGRDYEIRSEVNFQFIFSGSTTPPAGLSSEDLSIWRDEAKKLLKQECNQ